MSPTDDLLATADAIIPIAEAARRLGVTPALVRRWIGRGWVTPVTETRVVTTGIRAADLPALARRNRRAGRPRADGADEL